MKQYRNLNRAMETETISKNEGNPKNLMSRKHFIDKFKMERTLILIFAFVGITAMNNVTAQVIASGDCGENGNNLTWVLTNDSVLTISGSGAMKDWTYATDVTWRNYNKRIKSLVIGSSVTSIGTHAFDGDPVGGYYALTGTLTIPNSITKIGYGAFNGCSGLTGTLIIPNSVATIGTSAFYGCSGLTSLTISNSVTSIETQTFASCRSLKSLTIPNSVTSIKNNAFENCSGLTSLTIGSSVTTIGQQAFRSCSSLTSLTIPNSVTSIGQGVFFECSGLTSLTIPNSVIIIGYDAFWGTPWYNNKPDGIVYINNVLYKYKGTMPSGTTINIQSGTISISPSAFSSCAGLTGALIIPNSVTTIGDKAFGWCSGLTSLTIGSSIVSMGDMAFVLCNGLTSITSKAVNPPQIVSNTFSSVPTTIPVSVPCSSENTYKQTTYWNNFTNYTNCVTGLNDIAETANIIVYPNPATTKLYVKLAIQETVDYAIYNSVGQIIQQGEVQNNSTIDIVPLSKGIYYLKIEGNENAIKFVKN